VNEQQMRDRRRTDSSFGPIARNGTRNTAIAGAFNATGADRSTAAANAADTRSEYTRVRHRKRIA
jgi:hypothetical protein